MEGKYGPYVKWEKVNATLPKGGDPEALTMEAALELIEAKAGKKGKTKRKATARKGAKKEAPAKKAAQG